MSFWQWPLQICAALDELTTERFHGFGRSILNRQHRYQLQVAVHHCCDSIELRHFQILINVQDLTSALELETDVGGHNRRRADGGLKCIDGVFRGRVLILKQGKKIGFARAKTF